MNTDSRPIHLIFKKDDPTYLTDEMRNILENDLERRAILCTSWEDLGQNLKLKPLSICFFLNTLGDQSIYDVISMINTLGRLVGINYKISFSMGIRADTPYALVKNSQKTDIIGIVPSHIDYGMEECLKGVKAQWAGIPYWPKHIIEQLPGFQTKKIKVKKIDGIVLTPRQQQIMDLICSKGASNKIIARILAISESTVKLHVGHIFKKYGVRSRTQLAVFNRK